MIDKIKNGALVLLILSLGVLYFKYSTSMTQLENARINNKAYQNENNALKEDNIQFQLDLNTLKSMNDSISINMQKAIKDSKIQEKRIQQLLYINQHISKTDTIINTDTIFVPELKVDTIVGDQWYNLELKLRYPGTIIVNPSFNDKSTVIIHSSREYIKPRKKYWIQRIFQKKHTIIRGKVIKENPYSSIKEERFIKIIK